jgi:hypothetical protein
MVLLEFKVDLYSESNHTLSDDYVPTPPEYIHTYIHPYTYTYVDKHSQRLCDKVTTLYATLTDSPTPPTPTYMQYANMLNQRPSDKAQLMP